MSFLTNLWGDLRYGARMFVKNPAFSAIAVLSIALGTGANVAMFSVADALLLRPLPVARPDELVTVGTWVPRGIFNNSVSSYADYVDVRDRSQSFSGLLGYSYDIVGLTSQPGASPRVRFATVVTGNYFQVLGIDPAIGRVFSQAEDRVGQPSAVAVLSHGLWQTEFAADPSVVGRRIRVAGSEFEVVGVLPQAFTGLHPYITDSIFVPMATWSRVMDSHGVDPFTARDFRHLTLKGRLKPGVTLKQAQTDVRAIGEDLERLYPETNTNQGFIAQTEVQYRYERRPLDSGLLLLLLILSSSVLSVACANVAGLLASRAPVRAREMALRLAIGASRIRLIRQLLTESLAIAIVGGLGGLVVAQVGIGLLRQIQFPTDMIAPPVMRLDQRAMVFSVLIAMASAILVGLGPAVQMTRVDLANALKSTDTSARKLRRLTGRNVLVGIQVALSLVLLTIAGFSFQVFRQELITGPGFRTTQLAKVTLDPGQARYTEQQAGEYFATAVLNARTLPGVRSVTVTSAMPLFSFDFAPIVPEGHQMAPGQSSISVIANSVDEAYFDTMAIPLLAGRPFRSTDTAMTTFVAIANDTLVRHFWPGKEAIGRRFRLGGETGPWVEIVGIAKTSTYGYPGEIPHDALYFSFRQRPQGNMVLLARTAGESASVLGPLREMVRDLDPDVPLYDAQTIEVFYEARVTGIGTVITRLIGGMGAMGMMLTVVGLYGLVSYAVSRRTREIGIRIAIGASSGRILRMVLRQGMTPAWFGLAAGAVLSVTTVKLLPTVLPFSQTLDPATFFLVVPILFAVTLVAAFIPARRAAKVSPTVALRYD